MLEGLNEKDIAELFDRRVAELTRTILNSTYGVSSYKESYIPDAKDYRIAAISDIKQNGPATIIFLKNGNKVVVKCQDNPQHEYLGLIVCLIKYIVDNNRIYSDCINYIFGGVPYVFDRSNIKESTKRAEMTLISHIGTEDLLKIYDKFFGYEED